MLTRRQYVTAEHGRVVDISIPAILAVMNEYPGGIKDRWDCINKVRTLFFHFEQERQNED